MATTVERLILDRLDRIEERQEEMKELVIRMDERLQRLEDEQTHGGSVARPGKHRALARDGGLVVSGASVVAILQFVAHIIGSK